jgi:23S rRNA pseudouridine1911/1915/1917 synthase
VSDRFVVGAPGPLLQQLGDHFATWARNTLRQRLRMGCVLVNGRTANRHDHLLVPGDQVEVVAKELGQAARAAVPGLVVLHDAGELIAIDKPVGLLSVPAEDPSARTALQLLRSALPPGASLWPVHRLDRDTSGVLLFARSAAVCEQVRAQWTEVEKTYLAVVEGRVEAASGRIDAPLWEDKNLRVHVGDHADSKPARTRYRVLRRSKLRTLLEVQLETGRKHQIRAHLAHLGHPVVGDDRYGQRDARLGLHSLRLRVPDPVGGKLLEIVAEPPRALLALLQPRR